jgi:diguanylate cyclase (GGDEF)-like protein
MLVVDHSMPGISGFDLVKLLRQKMKRNDLVILGLSADTKGSLSAMFIKHGADDFLRKPFCPEELTCRVMFTLERRDMLRALKKAAQYDALTGLNNRRAFYEQGIQQFQRAQRSGHNLSVAMLDMDLFKQINDDYGHAAGDAALIGFSRAFRAAFPEALLGRLGGEEFAMVSPHNAESLSLALDELREQCRQVNYAVGAPPLSFSAGIYHGAPEDLESLLHLADQQLYQAKRQGRGRTLWQ